MRNAAAGRLKGRLAFFDRQATANDGFGNVKKDWEAQFTVWGGIHYLRGGEKVLGSRLEAVAPAICTVRCSSQTEAITSSWSFMLKGKRFYVKEDPKPTDNGLYFEFLCQEGDLDG